ncbi:probable elongator complex protein 2 [Nylanderia fulva]|uniref:probable elongator complex protein 2 n=1 Tax=Nylanderia fulva TaxID=613905 RepID=UPI0010FAD135|nr:probable elongator complex protein 2 [Nylanderia fulva]
MTSTRYIACSCNRVPHCADWGTNGLICFGTCNAIAIYEPDAFVGRVTHTLHRHRDRVNTVHWIRPARDGASETELLSGSVDGTAIIWRLEESQDNSKHCQGFCVSSVLDVGSIVTFADSLQLSDDGISSPHSRLLICTGSINGELKLWLRQEGVRITQTISHGRKLSIYCRLTYLPNPKCPLLAVALEDASVQLYIKESEDSNFVRVQSLLGHQDWVRCIDFHRDCDGNVFLATGSQDNTIRLWRITRESSSDEQKRDIFMINNREYSVILESVLSGHEGWVYGVHWQLIRENQNQTTRLLSSSLDKSMIIWELDESSGIWIERVRVGEVGGNSLGFYGCKFSPDGLHILAHGYQGSFHIWKYSQEVANWIPRSTPSGHFSEVIDLCWEPRGRFLITASTDQTTRVHAPWKDDLKELWHDIARPQIHGYDMTCLVMLTPYMYASGAEEKVVRIFTATSAFKNRLRLLADNVEDFKFTAAFGAIVPSLGLTNKATFDNEENDQRENKRDPMTKNVAYEPPTEEELTQNTLWPELQKLYGHGYEIFCMTARHDGQLLATACKSTNLEHSAIILWSTDTWSQVQKLISHQLTVTQMEFSPNGRYLLSVSRDRRWSLFKNEGENYALIAVSLKKDNPHSRIIWCCTWTSDSNYFATGSRDGKIGIWLVETMEDNIKDVIPKTILDKRNQSVTALCFASSCIKGSYILAIGYETGCIEIQKITVNLENIWSRLLEYDTSQAHHLTVKRLMFRPNNEHSCSILQLASCSSDHSVKIYDINLSSDLKT